MVDSHISVLLLEVVVNEISNDCEGNEDEDEPDPPMAERGRVVSLADSVGGDVEAPVAGRALLVSFLLNEVAVSGAGSAGTGAADNGESGGAEGAGVHTLGADADAAIGNIALGVIQAGVSGDVKLLGVKASEADLEVVAHGAGLNGALDALEVNEVKVVARFTDVADGFIFKLVVALAVVNGGADLGHTGLLHQVIVGILTALTEAFFSSLVGAAFEAVLLIGA